MYHRQEMWKRLRADAPRIQNTRFGVFLWIKMSWGGMILAWIGCPSCRCAVFLRAVQSGKTRDWTLLKNALIFFFWTLVCQNVVRFATDPLANRSIFLVLDGWCRKRNAPHLFSALRGDPDACPFQKNVQNPDNNAKTITTTKISNVEMCKQFK